MGLLNLPTELLLHLTHHLHNIEDFTNLSSTCRTLHTTCLETTPNTILRLAAAQSRIFFRPHPHFLVAATARELGQWALQSNANYENLRKAFQGGMEGLFELCVAKCGLTMEDIRRLHPARFSLLNPASDMIDRCAGKQWYDVPDFWNGGRSDAFTIDVEPERSVFQIIIFGELFRSTMDSILNLPGSSKLRFDLDTRLDFIKYCIPDWVCRGYQPGPNGSLGLEVLPIGPYTPCRQIDRLDPERIEFYRNNNPGFLDEKTSLDLSGDQTGLNHILDCRTWREAWEAVRHQIGPDFEDGWRQRLWHGSVQLQGLEGLEMLKPENPTDKWLKPGPLSEHWRSRLQSIRDAIDGIDGDAKPIVYRYGRSEMEATDAPMMADEVFICMATLWPGV